MSPPWTGHLREVPPLNTTQLAAVQLQRHTATGWVVPKAVAVLEANTAGLAGSFGGPKLPANMAMGNGGTPQSSI